MSSILFKIVMENLSQMLNVQVEARKIDTYWMSGSKASITQYADDVLVFTKANKKSLENLKKTMEEFLILMSWRLMQGRVE